jgi:hypothetical protein
LLDQPLIIGFNLPFDVGIILQWFPEFIDRVFDAFDKDCFHDASIAQRLGEIATGKPAAYMNLSRLCEYLGLGKLDKEDSPQKDYARFLGKELSEYPEAHRAYPLKDALMHRKCYERVRAKYGNLINGRAIASETRHAMWLHLCAAWGIRTDSGNLEKLRQSAHENVERLRGAARKNGFIRENNSKDTKVIKQRVADAYGAKSNWPLANKGTGLKKAGKPYELKHIAINKIALADSGDKLLEKFAEYGQWASVVNKDIPMLEAGLHEPIHTRYGLADTTRTTSSDPNEQNLRRLPGIRECIRPRPGKCFGAIDVGGLEMGTFAQVLIWCMGAHRTADLLNSGVNAHLLTAASLLKIPYEEAERRLKALDKEVKKARQLCKAPNFGYPGGMSAATFVPFARGQGSKVTLEQAVELKANWARTFPEGPAYLRWNRTTQNRNTGFYDFIIPGSPDILRARATYCSAANGRFQGLGAQAVKTCGWKLTREAWTDRKSPLYAIPMVMFIHDEFIYEITIGEQHEVMTRAREVIVESLHKSLPDVRLDAEPLAMSVWSKDAEPVYEKGRLQIWNP